MGFSAAVTNVCVCVCVCAGSLLRVGQSVSCRVCVGARAVHSALRRRRPLPLGRGWRSRGRVHCVGVCVCVCLCLVSQRVHPAMAKVVRGCTRYSASKVIAVPRPRRGRGTAIHFLRATNPPSSRNRGGPKGPSGGYKGPKSALNKICKLGSTNLYLTYGRRLLSTPTCGPYGFHSARSSRDGASSLRLFVCVCAPPSGLVRREP